MPRRWMRILALATLAVSGQTLSRADTLYLKNGQKIQGKIIEQSEDSVKINLEQGGTVPYWRDEIERIEVSEVPATPLTDDAAQPTSLEDGAKPTASQDDAEIPVLGAWPIPRVSQVEETLKVFSLSREGRALANACDGGAPCGNVIAIEIHPEGQERPNLHIMHQSIAANFIRHLFDRSDLASAAAFCQLYIKSAPGDPIPVYHFGRTLELAGRVTEAVVEYERAAGAPRYCFPDFRLWGIHQYVTNQPEKAQQALRRFEDKLVKLEDEKNGKPPVENMSFWTKQTLADELLYDAQYYDRHDKLEDTKRALEMALTLVPAHLRTTYLQQARRHLQDRQALEWVDRYLQQPIER